MAAPQWGASRRIFAIQRQYLELSYLPGSDKFIVVINPKYEGFVEEDVTWDDSDKEDRIIDNTKNKISLQKIIYIAIRFKLKFEAGPQKYHKQRRHSAYVFDEKQQPRVFKIVFFLTNG